MLLAVVYGKVAPAANDVPVPEEFVFHPLKLYPERVKVFVGKAELLLEILGDIVPDPVFALKSTIAPHAIGTLKA